jgi:hypothetical protein
MVAGCASQRNPYSGFADLSFSYDVVPSPLPDLTLSEVKQVERAQVLPSPEITMNRANENLPYDDR